MTENILWFNQIQKSDLEIVGGKGLNLGIMTQAKFPVPPGFVVTAQAYFKYIQETGIKEKILQLANSIDVDNNEELETVSAKIRALVKNTKMSKELEKEIIQNFKKFKKYKDIYLAVRSSGTAEDLAEASFAGQQETYLNVHGEKELIQRVRDCWASLFTARATYYRKKQGFETSQVGIAVVVQKMVNSAISGVMFTQDPTGQSNNLIVEAGYGLGESIVSGSITPDTFLIEKEQLQIIKKHISKQEWQIVKFKGKTKKTSVSKKDWQKQKITDQQTLEIAAIGKRIEAYYKVPQDIEWAIEDNELFIVQSRAITTLSLKANIKSEREKVLKTKDAKKILQGLAASPGIGFGAVRIAKTMKDAQKIKQGEVLVTKMTEPAWVPLMKKSSAIITDEGGITAHAAIVSRELGIPCSVGSGNATRVLKNGQIVTVNGYNGEVYDGKVELVLPETQTEKIIARTEIPDLMRALNLNAIEKQDLSEKELEENEAKILEILEKISAKVKVNVALPDGAQRAADSGAQGVGLLRAEHMIAITNKHPAQYLREGKYNELVQVVKKGILGVANAFKGYPVWYRTFDARTDEFHMLKGGNKEPKEFNPMMGWHGIRRDLDQPDLLKAQFQAIKELAEEGYTNIGVMLPFVIHVNEIQAAKVIAKQVGLELGSQKVKFGVMVETPAACWIIEDFAQEGINFVSFGTNDLTQLTLGIDRNNERIQKQFTELHPAVLGQIKMVIEKCKNYGIETSICGQAGSNPEMVKKLIQFGINSISANIDAVQKIKNTVMAEEKRILLAHLKNQQVF
ncbi:MAG: phosphoenolpyruvate synthase [Candidatus Diapherotrites archaeon]|nr:phosphoenolpyruvate synthase [Candidatus Diapherotrites archaeon]